MTKLKAMRLGGQVTASTLRAVITAAKPGLRLTELNELAESLIVKAGGEPSFKQVANYDWATCLDLNNGVVHGVPNGRVLVEGDLLSVDLGTFYQGYHTDAAWTVAIGRVTPPAVTRFLQTGKEALREAIKQVKPGNLISHLAQEIERVVTGAGYAVVRELVGHGVGRQLHEPPQIPGFLSRPFGNYPKIEVGTALAIEVIYTEGSAKIRIGDDGWSVKTVDNRLAGLFEQTVYVTANGPEVLTPAPDSV